MSSASAKRQTSVRERSHQIEQGFGFSQAVGAPFCRLTASTTVSFTITQLPFPQQLIENVFCSHRQFSVENRLLLEVRVQTPKLKYYWTRASCDRGRLQICDMSRRWNFCLMTTLTLIQTIGPSRRSPWS